MRLVIIESPFAGKGVTNEQIRLDELYNIDYARRAVRDSLSRGEAPIASHLLYTQPGILRDEVPEERQWGIEAGLRWHDVAEATIIYSDRGISKGMEYGIAYARKYGKIVEYRTLDKHDHKTYMK